MGRASDSSGNLSYKDNFEKYLFFKSRPSRDLCNSTSRIESFTFHSAIHWSKNLMFTYLEYTIAFLVVVWIFETYINVRQHRKYRERRIPQALLGIVSEEKFLKAQAYGLDKSRFGMFSDAFSLLSSIILLRYYWMPWLWELSGRWMVWISGSSMPSEVSFFPFFSYSFKSSS